MRRRSGRADLCGRCNDHPLWQPSEAGLARSLPADAAHRARPRRHRVIRRVAGVDAAASRPSAGGVPRRRIPALADVQGREWNRLGPGRGYPWMLRQHPPQVVVGDSDNPQVEIIHRGKYTSMTKQQSRWLKRRHAVEPTIGYLKSDHPMDRYRLQGPLGDTLLCAAGYNLSWLLRAMVRLGLKAAFLRPVLLKLLMLLNGDPSRSIRVSAWLERSGEFCRADELSGHAGRCGRRVGDPCNNI